MVDILEIKLGLDQVLQGFISTTQKLKMESEKKNNLLLKDAVNGDEVDLAFIDSLDRPIINIKFEEVFQERGEYSSNELAGIYFQGTQYFDFKNVYFINNTGIANLIDLIKELLKQGIAIKFVNVREKIKDKFKSMGLEFIFNCS
ncbi:MAG: STAS domain-containing protein [Bacteroidetes bacterium]|nr:STAS domain-containing protein [Bacteroidota bacterium]